MNDFVKVCPQCKSSNIIQKIPQDNASWLCMTCGNINFMPIEIMHKDIE
jgi:transposase-like protein